MLYPRSAVVAAARAFGLSPIDMVRTCSSVVLKHVLGNLADP